MSKLVLEVDHEVWEALSERAKADGTGIETAAVSAIKAGLSDAPAVSSERTSGHQRLKTIAIALQDKFWTEGRGRTPTVMELAQAAGVSYQTAWRAKPVLEADGTVKLVDAQEAKIVDEIRDERAEFRRREKRALPRLKKWLGMPLHQQAKAVKLNRFGEWAVATLYGLRFPVSASALSRESATLELRPKVQDVLGTIESKMDLPIDYLL